MFYPELQKKVQPRAGGRDPRVARRVLNPEYNPVHADGTSLQPQPQAEPEQRQQLAFCFVYCFIILVVLFLTLGR